MCFLGASAPAAAPKPAAAAAPAPAPVAPPPLPTPVVAAAAPTPMTAVEQRGPRVYASPMAKKLAETQKLRLEGNCNTNEFVNKNLTWKVSQINYVSLCPCVIRTRQWSIRFYYI